MSTDLGMGEALENPFAELDGSTRHSGPLALVIFGASGDLTARKLLPALAHLAARRALDPAVNIVGVARTEMGDEDFRKLARDCVPSPSPAWETICARGRYIQGDYGHPDTFSKLKDVLAQLETEQTGSGNRLYYLATIPEMFPVVAEALGEHGLASEEHGFARLVIEKPFGRDLQSAEQLDASVHKYFSESQVYRIDHYMGKETVQNVLALRFANAIFEPIWNRRYVDHVQVTVAESLGVEHRGGFYETAGALRDIVQNHVMQVLTLTLMEPPGGDAESIRDEKMKVLRSMEIPTPAQVATSVVRAQYDRGWVGGKEVPGYREEEGVSPQSKTETFFAMKLLVDNWRWSGVPLYVRTGKRLPRRFTEVAMQFQRVPHLPFVGSNASQLGANALVLRIQPDEGITLRFGAKVPGQEFRLRTVSMDFSYGGAFLEETPDAYERLLLDAMVGDPTLFIRSDEVRHAWQVVDPVLESYADPAFPLARYVAGTWGPPEAEALLRSEGRIWGIL